MNEEHDYLSTACYHLTHENCRFTCKFCPAKCRCDCHGSDDMLVELKAQYTAILESYRAIQENYAGIASDVEKIKKALNIDVEPVPSSEGTIS